MSTELNLYFFLSIIFLIANTYQQDTFRLLQLYSKQTIIVRYSSVYLSDKDLSISAKKNSNSPLRQN